MLPQGAHEGRVDFILPAAARRHGPCWQQIITIMADERTAFAQAIGDSFFGVTPPRFVVADAMNGRRIGLSGQCAQNLVGFARPQDQP